MREFAVIDDMPQKNWATMTTMISSMPMALPAAKMKIVAHGTRSTAMESYPVYSMPLMVTGKACGIAKLTATSRMKPAIMEIQMELTMPFGAEIARVDRLFRDVCGGVVAGERVLRVQEADEEDVQRDR